MGVPDHITKSAENAREIKLLTGAKAEDKMRNKDHERKDELEMQKCEMCQMHYEMCGTYLTTRANTYDKEVLLPKTHIDRNSDGRNQMYQIADPKVDKHRYDELSGSRWYLLAVFRIWGYWIEANRKLLASIKNRKVNGNMREFNVEKET